MSNWQTEETHTSGGALIFGIIAAGIGILFIGLFVIRPISDAATEREQARAYAIAAQSQAQIAAERERTERTAQEQITARAGQEHRAEISIYGIVLLAGILAFGLVIASAVGLVYGLEKITGAADERRHQRLLIYTAQLVALSASGTPVAALPAPRPSITIHEVN